MIKQCFANRRLGKKAQVEILGLVMVVLLISIGILIAILIFSKPMGQEVRYEQESLLAANFLNTLVKSDAACKGRTVGELIQACVGSSVVICDNGLNACAQAKSLISVFLDKVFFQEGKSYFFEITDRQGRAVDNLEDFVFGKSCKGEFESKTRPLVFVGGEVYLKLDVCY